MNRALAGSCIVFRGLRRTHLTDGQPNFRAFTLRAEEEGLSVSESQAHALAALTGLKGTAALEVRMVRSLSRLNGTTWGLDVVSMQHPTDPGYAWIIGLPPYADEGSLARSVAHEAASALCNIARFPA